MSNVRVPKNVRKLPTAVLNQILALATSGFGLAAALAWNELIKNLIETYIRPYLGAGSDLLSRFIYAVAITGLAVMITLQLSTVKEKVARFSDDHEEPKEAPVKPEKKRR